MLSDLEGVASLVFKLSANYNKDSEARKTCEYLNKRRNTLETYWSEFCRITEELPSEQLEQAATLINQIELCYETLNNDISEKLKQIQAVTSASSNINPVPRPRGSSVNTIPCEVPKTRSTSTNSLADEKTEEVFQAPETIATPSSSSITKEESLPAKQAVTTNNVTSKNSINIMSTLTIPEALRLVPEYDGNSSELHQFINACDTVRSLLAEEHKENFFKVLKLKLKGKAYDIIKYDDIKNLEGLKAKLNTQFLETRTLETIQVELVSVKQKYNESETDYANRVERLLSDLNTACIPTNTAENISKPIRELNARTALRAFQEGLREPLKLLVKASRYATLKAATDAAISEGKQYPLSENKQRLNNHSSPKFCSHCRKSGHTFDECRTKLKCTRCHRFGHSVGQCRDKVPQNSNQPRAQVSVVSCKYCKNAGHHIDQCRKLEYNRRNNSNSGNSKSPATRATVAATEATPAQQQ